MVPILPAGELADLEAIALLSGLAAGPTALAGEPLDQQRIAPEDSTCFCGIEKTRDVCERLSLIHAVENGWKIFANRFANGLILGLRLKTEIGCAGMVEGGIPPPRVTWVIRLTSPHLP